MRRRFFALASVLSLVLCLLLGGLWFRSRERTDRCMIPMGKSTALLLTSHWGGWGELTILSGWPEPRLARWSGTGWRNVGPFLIWTHLGGADYEWGGFWESAGVVMVPRDGPGQGVALEHSYDRALALGYPQTMAPPPDSLLATARQLKLPFGRSIVLLAVLPGLYAFRQTRRTWTRWRSARRDRMRLCRSCGYDLRATTDRCPECGAPAPAAAPDPPTYYGN